MRLRFNGAGFGNKQAEIRNSHFLYRCKPLQYSYPFVLTAFTRLLIRCLLSWLHSKRFTENRVGESNAVFTSPVSRLCVYLRSTHTAPFLALCTAELINCMPRRPSYTVGKAYFSGSSGSPSIYRRIACTTSR